MGCQGEDIILSPAARKLLPISIEAKSHAKYAVYKDFEQAKYNSVSYTPVLIIKQNNDIPLAIVSLEYFLQLMEKSNETTIRN